MKTQPRQNVTKRNPELGAMAIVVGMFWMTLFGFAAFAVDIGYAYTNRRGLKAITVAAVKAGMPAKDIAAATAVLTANGYTNGVDNVTATAAVSGNNLQVDLQVPQPTFFLKLFGMSTKTVSARSIGTVTSTSSLAILATGAAGGVTISGNNNFTINGNVESAGLLLYSNGTMIGTTNGNIKSSAMTPTVPPAYNTVTGTISMGPISANPFAAVTLASFPACTYGNLSSPYVIPFGNWTIGAGPVFGSGPMPSDTLAPGVYCSGGILNVAPPGGSMKINAPNVTFLATGNITIGANNGAHFGPAAAGSPNNIFLFTTAATSCGAGQAINVGLNYFEYDARMYAPNGCIRAGGRSLVLNQLPLVANEINLGLDPFAPWVFGPAGGGGGAWQMVE